MPTSEYKTDDICREMTCRQCHTRGDIEFAVWESFCGGFEDIKYHCKACGYRWVVEGPDA